MPDTKISALPAAAAALGAMEFGVNDAGTSRKVTLTQVGTLLGSGAAIGAHVTRSAVQSIPTGTETAVTWDTETRDDGGLHDGVTPSRLTAPVAGWYQISTHASFAANSTGLRQLAIRLNNTSDLVWTIHTNPGATTAGEACSVLAYLTENDYVEVRAYQTSGGNLNVAQYGHFAMVKVA